MPLDERVSLVSQFNFGDGCWCNYQAHDSLEKSVDLR
jgi:hypothetical protein